MFHLAPPWWSLLSCSHSEPKKTATKDCGGEVSRLYPSGHVFGPLLSPFRTKFTRYSSHSARNTQKTSYNTRYPLGTKYYKERGISNYSAGVSLRLTPRFAHISSSDPSTARSSLEGPASGSSQRSSMYSGTGSTAAVVNSLRA